jgi:hypothetical protein
MTNSIARPWCEEMTTRPAQSGWQQWGVLSVDGKTFEPLYGLETALPRESAFYYLVAETPQPQGTPTWAWGVGAVLLIIVGGAAATRARRKQTDTTPQPQGFTFNKGDSDATR